jgi:hypothetical protein
MDGNISQPILFSQGKLLAIDMICRALINRDEGVGLPKTLGKKKLFECRLPIKQLDEYTMICPAGHRKRTVAWEERSFISFFQAVKIKKVH